MRDIFTRSYRDALLLLRQMWTRLLLLLGLSFGVGLLTGLLTRLVHTRLGETVVELLGVMLASWLTAPCFIALYRFVRNGDRSLPSWQSETTIQYFAWAAVIQSIIAIPGFVLVVWRDFSADEAAYLRLAPGLMLVLYAATLVFLARIVTLLAAVAAGRRMSFAVAFAETRGRFWYIVGATLLVILPVAAAMLAGAVLLVLLFGSDSADVAVAVAFGVGVIFAVLLGVAFSSQLADKFALPDTPQ